MPTLIAPGQDFAVLAALLAVSALGLVGESRGWFGRFPGVLVTLLAAGVLTVLRVIPSSVGPAPVPVYDAVASLLIPLAIPLLLLDADLRTIVRECGRLAVLFLAGAAGTLAGVALAHAVLDMGADGAIAAALFVATFVGGLVNFMTTAEMLEVAGSPVFLSAVAADGLLNNVHIAVLFLLAASPWVSRLLPDHALERSAPAAPPPGARPPITIEHVALALLVSATLCALAAALAAGLEAWLEIRIRLQLLVLTVLALAVANLWPRRCQRLSPSAFPVGNLFLYVFLAMVGAGMDFQQLFAAGPRVFVFAAITIAVHLAVLLAFAYIFRFGIKEVALVSNAAIGGPTTAAPMAAAFQLPHAITPAILVGLLGYSIGTFAALWTAALFR